MVMKWDTQLTMLIACVYLPEHLNEGALKKDTQESEIAPHLIVVACHLNEGVETWVSYIAASCPIGPTYERSWSEISHDVEDLVSTYRS